MRDIQVQHSGGHVPVSAHNYPSDWKVYSIQFFWQPISQPSCHPLFCYLNTLLCPCSHRLILGWEQHSNNNSTCRHKHTHRTTSCQETLTTSKIAHKHKGETLEIIQKERVSLACSTLAISSQLLKVIYTLTHFFQKNVVSLIIKLQNECK